MNDDPAVPEVFSDWGSMPPPRPIELRIRLAIYWALQGALRKDELPDDLSPRFIRELQHVGLKLVWEDGSAIPPVKYPEEP